jgi:hypothetical protein
MTPSTDPDERSYRIRLPPLGEDAQAHERIRMTNTSRWKPSRKIAPHAAPRQVVTLAATSQYRPPQVTRRLAKSAQRGAVHGHPVIAEVPQQDRAQVCSLFPNGRVHASPQFFFQSPQLSLPPLAHRLAQYREMPLPGFPAAVRSRAYISRLNTRPVRTPVNASTPPSRAAPHDSGRCGSLFLQRMKLSFTTPCRFRPAHGGIL